MKGARLLVLALLASACTSENRVELQLVLRTDYRAYEEFVAMEVHVEGATGEAQRRHFVAEPTGDYVEGVVLGEVVVPPGRTRIEATLRGVDGGVLLERPVLVTADSRRIITVVMTRDCAEVSCESDNQACVSGRCADATCTPDQPESCGTPQCESATDCEVDSPCAVADCRSGQCLLVESGDVCGGGEWCHPEEGCLPSRIDRQTRDARLCPSDTCLSLRSHLVFPHAQLEGGAVAAMPGGGVLLGFQSPEDIAVEGASAPGGDDANSVLIALDRMGRGEWIRRFDDVGFGELNLSTEGEIALTGNFWDQATLGLGTLDANPEEETNGSVVALLDAMGNPIWNVVPQASTEGPYLGSAAFMGEHIVTGGIFLDEAIVDTAELRNTYWSSLFARLDRTTGGDAQLSHPIGMLRGNVHRLVGTTDGRLFLNGRAFGSIETTDGTVSVQVDAIVTAELDADGNALWLDVIDGTGRDFGGGVDASEMGVVSGGILDAGEVSLDGMTLPVAGASDALIASYDFDGTRRWSRVFGSPSADTVQGVTIDDLGRACIITETAGPVEFDEGQLGAPFVKLVTFACFAPDGALLSALAVPTVDARAHGIDFDEDGETVYALVSFGPQYQLEGMVRTTTGPHDAVLLTLDLPRP